MRASTSFSAVKPKAPSARAFPASTSHSAVASVSSRGESALRGVEVQHVDAVGAQARQRGLHRANQIDRTESRVVGVAADAHGQHDVVAQAAGADPLPDDVLAAAGGVRVGGVHRVAAELDVAVEDLVARFEVDVPAELGAAEHQREDSGARLTQRDAHDCARPLVPAREWARMDAGRRR